MTCFDRICRKKYVLGHMTFFTDDQRSGKILFFKYFVFPFFIRNFAALCITY